MTTGPQTKRKKLRQDRLAAESAIKKHDRRRTLSKIVGLSLIFLVVGVTLLLVAISRGTTERSSGPDVKKALSGISQEGTTLGDSRAEVTLVEFGDLQCPVCRMHSSEVLPSVVEGPVRKGVAKIDFKQLPILGEDSTLAAKAAIAAADQGVYWEFIETFYARQKIENSGYVSDGFLTDIAEESGVEDIEKWNGARESDRVEQSLAAMLDEASTVGFSSTPSYAILEPDGDLQPIEANSSDPATNAKVILDAIADAVLANGS